MNDNNFVVQRLREKYPHHVFVKGYFAKMQAGTIPRLENIEGTFGSWVTEPGSRTFGFETKAEADAFREKHAPEETIS